MKTQVIEIVSLLLSYQEALMDWNASPIQIYSSECIGFSVSTSKYNGAITITFLEGSFYMVEFAANGLHVIGISSSEKTFDVIKDYLDKREVWV